MPNHRPFSIAAIGCALLITAAARAQEKASTDWNAAVVKASEHRRYAMRRAVSKRIAQAGAEAVPAIRAYAEAHGNNKIPMLLVNAIATEGTSDDEVVTLLHDWSRDKEFYWRSQALGGLVNRGLHDRFGELYVEAMQDPSHLYRFEGMRGWFEKTGKESGQFLLVLHVDPDPRLRIRLASLLAEQGGDTGYFVLISALAQRNVFLGDAWGAREAKRALAAATTAAGGKDFDYDLAATVEENTDALEAFSEALLGEELRNQARVLLDAPALAQAPPWHPGDAQVPWDPFTGGLSIRSCRHGDLFLRWNDKHGVSAGLLGRRPAVIADDRWPALRDRLAELVTDRSISGKVVCDFVEVVHGPHRLKCAPGAVPAELAAWLRELADALGDSSPPATGEELQSRLGQFVDTDK